jgi:hypothetical protein
LRRFNSAKKFFGFTLPACTKRSSPAALYLDAGDLKSTATSKTTGEEGQPAHTMLAPGGRLALTSQLSIGVVEPNQALDIAA